MHHFYVVLVMITWIWYDKSDICINFVVFKSLTSKRLNPSLLFQSQRMGTHLVNKKTRWADQKKHETVRRLTSTTIMWSVGCSHHVNTAACRRHAASHLMYHRWNPAATTCRRRRQRVSREATGINDMNSNINAQLRLVQHWLVDACRTSSCRTA